MGVKIGNIDVSYFKVGGADCSIYLGNDLMYPTTPPTPTFEGKYKLILNDSSVVSGDCDGDYVMRESDVSAYSASVSSIIIGDCVTQLPTGLFKRYSGLTSCVIGSGVTSIGNSVFEECKNLASVNIPNGVTHLNGSTFKNCENLLEIIIPSGVTQIDNYCFSSCYQLSSITIPDSVSIIKSYAFNKCSGATSVNIGSGVTKIYMNAFNSCKSLTSFTINTTTPPFYGSGALSYTNDCPIYVPSESVEAYKAASGWSSLSSRIQAIPSPTPTYQWVSYRNGDTVPTATTVYGVKIYLNYDKDYNVIFSGATGDYIRFYPNDNFGQWSAEDENGNPINISSYFDGYEGEYTIIFSDLGMGGMNIISPSTTFEDDIELYEIQ